MLDLEIQRNQYLVLGIVGGMALVLGWVLAYVAMWRQRELGGEETVAHASGKRTVLSWLHSFMPWVLVILYVGAVVYAVAYTYMTWKNPPNW